MIRSNSRSLKSLKKLLPEFFRSPASVYDNWDGRVFSKKIAFWAGFSLIISVASDILLLRALPLVGWPLYIASMALFLLCSIALLNFVYSNLWGRYRLAERMANVLVAPSVEKILDLDVGEGVFAAAFAAKLTAEGKIYGLGRWRENRFGKDQLLKLMSQLQQKQVQNKIALAGASLFTIPFENDTFDLVFFKESEMNKVPKDQIKDLLTELLRVLKPGGQFVILTADRFTEMRAGLKELGIKKCRYSKRLYELFPLYRMLRGNKPEI